MKRWITWLLTVLLLLTAAVYIIIPGTLVISEITVIACPKNAAGRMLLDESKWRQWWPSHLSNDTSLPALENTFHYNGRSYRIMQMFTDRVNILITSHSGSYNSAFYLLPYNNNSVTLHWECRFATAYNPLKRIRQYREATYIKDNMASVFNSLKAFLEKTENVYGFPIHEIISKDSTLIATRHVTKAYPSTREIYDMVDTMKRYIAEHGAIETNYPMLRVTQLNDSSYQTMIAISTSKRLAGNGFIFFQRFVPWKTLAGTVKGGVHTVEQAFDQMNIFVEDHQRTSMAVPFQSLVTDRRTEPDTLKWVTIIYQPVS